ncbi:MAG: sodium transporter, partial [Chitinophagaceae bacterium]|nr:sodium transporter [Chitinophagaceae bacterium]
VEITTIILGLLIILYTAIGGIWAVVVTDVLQLVVLTVAVLLVVPLSFNELGGVSSFVEKAPEHFFRFFNEEYSIGFLIAFALYNLFFISGNWAYIQRYTSVRTQRDAKKVGWLFAGLYFISPVIWMLPPMIYRIINPTLEGLDPEGAYLMMCKVALPVGMLGMILGAMIFATSSSVNTTLNIAAGVFTNDLYKHFFPASSEKRLMKVARYSTVTFGLATIVVALLVPYMGGIIEVVLSVGAITGAPLFLPPLWSLFSKKQTGRSVLVVTIISLAVNLFMKFVSPHLFGFALTRAQEMITGVGIPIFLLLYFEIKWRTSAFGNTDYERYLIEVEKQKTSAPPETGQSNDTEARQGRRVISLGVLAIGFLVILLGIKTIQTGILVLFAGILLLIVGLLMYPGKNRRIKRL